MDIVSDVRYSVLKEKIPDTDSPAHRILKGNLFDPEMNSFELANKNASTNHLIPKDKDKEKDKDKDTSAHNTLISKTNDEISNNNNINNNGAAIASNSDTTNVINIPELEYNTFITYKNKRTLTEKILFLLNILLLLVLLMFILSSLTKSNSDEKIITDTKQQQQHMGRQTGHFNSNSSNSGEYCDTDMCILVAGSIYKSLNKKVDPCDDFYEYRYRWVHVF